MALQLQHVFPGVGMRRRKIKRQALIYWRAMAVAEIGERRVPRLQRPTDNLFDEGRHAGTGQTDYAYATAPGGRGNRGDEIVGSHGQRVYRFRFFGRPTN